MIFDTAIIGSGPAGISAALNLKIHEKKFIWLGSKALSDKISKAEKIMNYPGLKEISGMELNQAFSQQIEGMDIEITEHMVNSIMPFSGHFALMAGNEFYEAKTIILATGVANQPLLQRERELLGKGVSYCATCDGGLYRYKKIAVICSTARFEHEVKYLAELAEKVYFYPTYPGASKISDNVEKITERPLSVEGQDHVTGISLKNGQLLEVDGVFCLRDSISLSTLLPGLELEEKHIKVNRRMETSIAGVYAAGDCTGRPYQYTTAVGEGNTAAHSALEYLAKLENE